MSWRESLTRRFGARVSFDPAERMLYGHDVASLPEAVTRLFQTLPEAVVQPESVEELRFLVDLAREHRLPLVPRGAGTSGYGGAVPARGGLVVETVRMDQVLEVDAAAATVSVEPGIIWTELERVLHRYGLALRLYPTSAPGSTVGGWVAEGGTGIGSYEYGPISANLVAVEALTPTGEIRTFSGEDLSLVCGLEGTTGIITKVTLRCRRKEEDIPALYAFPSRSHLTAFLNALVASELPVWHVAFSSPEFVAQQQRAANREVSEAAPQVLLVYPASRARAGQAVSELATRFQARPLSSEQARLEWKERYYPMRLKRLGPSLIPSEALVPVQSLEAYLEELEKLVPGLAVEGTLVADGTVAVLGFRPADERSPVYALGYGKSLLAADLARKYGGRVYSLGLFFGDYAPEVLGQDLVRRVQAFKQETDPEQLFNPGKVLGSDKTALRLALKAVRVAKPLLGMAESVLPQGVRESDRLPKPLLTEAYACAQCGYCRPVCTLYHGRGWESASPRGKWYLLRKYAEGKLELTQELVNTFLLCTTCKRCDPVCQVNIPIQARFDELRGLLVRDKGYATFPAFEMMGASFGLEHNIWANFKADRDAWVPREVEIAPAAEIGYWAGCTASYVERDIAVNAVRILQQGGLKFTYLGKDEACCGVPFFMAGKWDQFELAVRHNVAELAKRGVKTLVVSCPGCWVTLRHYYRTWAPKFGLAWEVEIRHLTEVTAELVRQGRLKFTTPVHLKLTWHDPCHIGRHGGIYEPPREVLKALPGAELVEMASNREEGRCCGSVLTRIGEPRTSDEIVDRRLEEAAAVRADAVVTTCPCCEFQLRIGVRSAGLNLPVRDFANVVAEALGYEVEDPTPLVHQMWGVFARAIDMMSLEGMVEMMTALLPGMMDHLPGSMKAGMSTIGKLPEGLQDLVLKAAGTVMPKMMPKMLPEIMPKMFPQVQAYMEEQLPDMPASMKALLPEMLPTIMERLMPAMLPGVLALMKEKMLAAMKEALVGRRGV